MDRKTFPEDFQECVRFHGHLCPGLAIGYAAVKAGRGVLALASSEDEEIVAIVENDSCAVDAVQVLLGCTFGKGNLVFRDWGKQAFTFMERRSGRGVRVAFRGPMPLQDERHALKLKIDAGGATDADRARWDDLRVEATHALVSADPGTFFDVREVTSDMPAPARIVTTELCEVCGENVMTTRLVRETGRALCRGCAAAHKK
jgi:formylmethanofuran dehydrogenase subunit E